jgi:hypothetical protein
MLNPRPTSWRSIRYGTPVISSDDERGGEVREVLGSDAEDIFHGLRVRVLDQRRDVMVDADDVLDLSARLVHIGLTAAELGALGPYDERATYHLASVGWLRRHLGWKPDARSDEEPG